MSGRMEEQKWTADFVISEANLYRSRDYITVAQNQQLPVGTLMNGNAAATAAGPGQITSILMHAVDSRGAGAQGVRAAVLARHAEVNDAYLMYGAFARDTVKTTLGALGIIVREGVQPASIATPASATTEGASDHA